MPMPPWLYPAHVVGFGLAMAFAAFTLASPAAAPPVPQALTLSRYPGP